MGSLNCKKKHSMCKAKCCGVIDFEVDFWEKHKDKIISEPTNVTEFPCKTRIIPQTDSGYCVFLRKDFHCNIYEDRPQVCRDFGNESNFNMSCPYLDKNGKDRPKKDRIDIQKKVNKGLRELRQELIKIGPVQNSDFMHVKD